jgi:hypothetical protein
MSEVFLTYENYSRNLWYVLTGQGPTYILSYKFKKDDVLNFTRGLINKSSTPISCRVQQNIAFMCKDTTEYKQEKNMFDLAEGDHALYSESSGTYMSMLVSTPFIVEVNNDSDGCGVIVLKSKSGDTKTIKCLPNGKDTSGRIVVSCT